MKVRVYRNLTKGCWSVQRYIKGKGWRLHEHRDSLQLSMAKPKVSEAGRQRVIRERKKYVHAFLEGWLIDSVQLPDTKDRPVRYNPFHGPEFLSDGKVVSLLQVAHFRSDGKLTGVR